MLRPVWVERGHVGMQKHDWILKVIRTIANFAGAERVGAAHVMKAINYRALDPNLWA